MRYNTVMATVLQSLTLPPPFPAQPLPDLASELAEAFHVMAECWSRGVPVPDPLLNRVDRLLARAETAQSLQEKIA